MPDTASELPLVYPVSPRRRWLLAAIWSLFTLPLLAGGLVVGDASAVVTGILAGSMLGVIFLLTAWRYPRLVLDRNGVTLRQLGFSLETAWDNIVSLRLARGQAGLILKQPMTGRGADRMAAIARSMRHAGGPLRLYPPEVLESMAARCYIPIEPFRYWLIQGDLGRRLARHAPRLTDMESQR